MPRNSMYSIWFMGSLHEVRTIVFLVYFQSWSFPLLLRQPKTVQVLCDFIVIIVKTDVAKKVVVKAEKSKLLWRYGIQYTKTTPQ